MTTGNNKRFGTAYGTTRERLEDYAHAMKATSRVLQILVPVDRPKPISKTQRRRARKEFPRHKQVPAGYKLQYRIDSSIDSNPVPSERLKAQWALLDDVSLKMFHKKYDNCTKRQKASVIESLHKES